MEISRKWILATAALINYRRLLKPVHGYRRLHNPVRYNVHGYRRLQNHVGDNVHGYMSSNMLKFIDSGQFQRCCRLRDLKQPGLTHMVYPEPRFEHSLESKWAFSSLASRQQYTCIRLHAFIVLVQACADSDNLASFFNAEPEFINELVTLLSYEDAIPENNRILSILSLIATCQDRARQPGVLTAVTTGGHQGILSSLMQKAIDAVATRSSKLSVTFAEVLSSLVTVLLSSSSGCSAMREAGFIPTLLPLLKDTEPQHLHLASMAVHVLETFMDYSNPTAALFRDLGGLDDTIMRLKVEVSHVESCSSPPVTSAVNIDSSDSEVATESSSEQQNIKPIYSEPLVAYHRRLLMNSLLRAISLGTYAPGASNRVSGSEESMLPQCLSMIFKRAKEFGGDVFSLAATVMSDLIHKDPTCFGALEAADLPSTFLNAIMDGVLCSSEAIVCISQCLDGQCLNNNGLQAVKDHNALRCFVKIYTSKAYLRSLTGDTPGSLSSGLDELMRHASSLRGPGVEVLIEILNSIAKLGSMTESPPSTSSPSSSGHVPMETDSEDKGLVSTDGEDLYKGEITDQAVNICDDACVESFLPESYIPLASGCCGGNNSLERMGGYTPNGLRNWCNNCHFNAALQVLLSLREVRDSYLAGPEDDNDYVHKCLTGILSHKPKAGVCEVHLQLYHYLCDDPSSPWVKFGQPGSTSVTCHNILNIILETSAEDWLNHTFQWEQEKTCGVCKKIVILDKGLLTTNVVSSVQNWLSIETLKLRASKSFIDWCSRGRADCNLTKKFTKLPRVLLINNVYNPDNIDERLTFDKEIHAGESTYYLKAVVEHLPPGVGHLRTYVRRGEDWFLADDERVSRVHWSKVRSICRVAMLAYEVLY